jgi:hypothetical protein
VVDDLTPDSPAGQPVDPVGEGTSSPPEQKTGLFANPVVRIIGIVAAVLLVLGICAVVAMLLFTFFLAGEAEDMLDEAQVQSTTPTGTASAEATGAAPSEPDPISYSRLFTFRDIFNPFYEAPIVCETTGTVEGTSTTEGKLTADVSEDTLFLEAVVIEDGQSTAVVLFNGEEYRLVEGDSVPGTPWQVLTVGETSVVMLYGDQQVTLSIGQGTSR